MNCWNNVLSQEIKDIYLFGIVAVLLLLDIVFMIPTTVVSSAVLRREEKELEGENVSDTNVQLLL